MTTHWQSTAPAAHAYLVTQIPTTLGIQTFNRSSLGTDLENDRFVVGEVTSLVQDFATLGGTISAHRDETYDIHCLITVFRGDDPTSADMDTIATVAWGYYQQVIELIATDTTLGSALGIGGWAEMKTAYELPPEQPLGGIEFALEFEIACRAMLVVA